MSMRSASRSEVPPLAPVSTSASARRDAAVGQVMRMDAPTVSPDTTLAEILEIAWQRGTRHVLVMDGPRLVGIISDRDLKRVLRGDGGARSSTTAGDIMTRTVITISPTANLTAACDTMVQEAISALPVVQDGVLRGLITDTEILTHLARCA